MVLEILWCVMKFCLMMRYSIVVVFLCFLDGVF